MDVKKLMTEFKHMSLPKQAIIVVCTITLIVLVLSNFKNMKEASIKFVDSFTNDESVKAFMQKMDTLVKKCARALRDVVGLEGEDKDEPKSEPERQQLND